MSPAPLTTWLIITSFSPQFSQVTTCAHPIPSRSECLTFADKVVKNSRFHSRAWCESLLSIPQEKKTCLTVKLQNQPNSKQLTENLLSSSPPSQGIPPFP